MRFAKKADRDTKHGWHEMVLIGHWENFIGYYRDVKTGECWTFSGTGQWINNGPAGKFYERFAEGKYRGNLV